MISPNPEPIVAVGLFGIFLVVLLGPFLIKKIEHNLEAFLFIMGVAAVTLNTFFLTVQPVATPGHELAPNWNLPLIFAALKDPIEITAAVFIVGLLFYWIRAKLRRAIDFILTIIPMPVFVFLLVVLLGLLSSIITAIIASLLLVELVSVLNLSRKNEVSLVILACFAIGLGAALTPVGEPLSTIVIRTKLQEHFWYLLVQIGKYIIPGVVVLGFMSVLYARKNTAEQDSLRAAEEKEKFRDVVIRAFKVYIFVMALVLLGIGFLPITEWYIKSLRPELLYWANITSAILDNATLASAEISRNMTALQLNSALMGLLIAGGMLIPGNIPNIIAANKLGITSKEWAKLGVPLGLIILVIYFVILFVFKV